jgi:hypothetical protein
MTGYGMLEGRARVVHKYEVRFPPNSDRNQISVDVGDGPIAAVRAWFNPWGDGSLSALTLRRKIPRDYRTPKSLKDSLFPS